MIQRIRNLKNRFARRLRIKRLVWRLSLLSLLDSVMLSDKRPRKKLRMKVTRVTRNMLKSR
jgi:hypothetical protein